jgi:stage V sporulation protein AC
LNIANPNKFKQVEMEEYQTLVDQIKPKPNVIVHCVWAFVVGGLICGFAQLIMNFLLTQGMNRIDAGSAVSGIMIFLAAFFNRI